MWRHSQKYATDERDSLPIYLKMKYFCSLAEGCPLIIYIDHKVLHLQMQIPKRMRRTDILH